MSANKAKGTAFETLCLPAIREHYPESSRAPLHGALDKGDYIIPGAPFILQAKNHKAMKLNEWLQDAQEQARNAGKPVGAVVHKRRSYGQPEDQYVTLALGDFLWLVSGVGDAPQRSTRATTTTSTARTVTG